MDNGRGRQDFPPNICKCQIFVTSALPFILFYVPRCPSMWGHFGRSCLGRFGLPDHLPFSKCQVKALLHRVRSVALPFILCAALSLNVGTSRARHLECVPSHPFTSEITLQQCGAYTSFHEEKYRYALPFFSRLNTTFVQARVVPSH
jgi:hypothetical protein